MAEGARAAASTANGSNGAPRSPPPTLRSRALGLLQTLRLSVELLVALAALLSWITVGVVMFDFVEYKTVPDIQQIVSDPVQAVNDAVDEVTSLLNKFQECAPDLSDPSAAATYAAEEIIHAKDGFVQYFSDEEGVFYPSYVDPVVIGRRAFHTADEFMSEVGDTVQDTLCATADYVMDTVLDIHKGKLDISYLDPVVIGRGAFTATNDFMSGITGYIQEVLCSIMDTLLSVSKGTTDISFMDPVVIGRSAFTVTNDAVDGVVGYIQEKLCFVIDSILGVSKGTTDFSFIDPVVIGRNAFRVTDDFMSGIAKYIQGVLCSFLDVILDTVGDAMEAVGFSPLSVLKTTADITKEQMSMLSDYISTTVVGEQGILPEISVNPMKMAEEAVLEATETKDAFVAYMSSMFAGEQVEEKKEDVPSEEKEVPADIVVHMVDAGTPPGLPVPQAPGAPMLSRLLEAGPTQFSAPLGFMVSGDSAVSRASPVTEDTDASACAEQNTMPSTGSGCMGAPPEDKETELSEEDVNVAYMGDELDLKTVGDIIAIIEDKADESAEALDAAAVEAALSLCEESGHTLGAAWASGPFQPQDSGHTVAPIVSPGAPQCSSHQSSPVAKTELAAHGECPSLCNSQDNCLGPLPRGLKGLSPTSLSSCNSSLEHCNSRATSNCGSVRKSTDDMLQANQISTKITLKCESDKWTHHRFDKGPRDSVLEDSPLTERSLKEAKIKDETGIDAAQAECESPGAEDCGVKVEEDDAFLSELEGDMELEPAASESEDGYSLHTASSSLHLNTTADSIPSSPASSQFSMCSEDQEALQAHKIWKKAIMLVWRAAANHRYANVFLQPVTDEIAPGYHSIVHRPMDLATIKKNIETGLIRTTAEFQRDIMLMFQNAVMYNSLDHDVYHMALEMQRDVLEQVQQFLATQLIMETSESGISAKSLRGRDSTRRQDSTDKDGGTRGRRCAMEADLKMKK